MKGKNPFQIWEERLSRIEKKFSTINKRIGNVLSNQKHYLRYRAPLVMKRQKHLLDHAYTLARKLKDFPKIKPFVIRKAKCGEVRHVLLVTQNQARRLRRLADTNLLPLLLKRKRRKNENNC